MLVRVNDRKEVIEMKRFVAREVETLKTTSAMYGCDYACCWIVGGCYDFNK